MKNIISVALIVLSASILCVGCEYSRSTQAQLGRIQSDTISTSTGKPQAAPDESATDEAVPPTDVGNDTPIFGLHCEIPGQAPGPDNHCYFVDPVPQGSRPTAVDPVLADIDPTAEPVPPPPAVTPINPGIIVANPVSLVGNDAPTFGLHCAFPDQAPGPENPCYFVDPGPQGSGDSVQISELAY